MCVCPEFVQPTMSPSPIIIVIILVDYGMMEITDVMIPEIMATIKIIHRIRLQSGMMPVLAILLVVTIIPCHTHMIH